MAGLDLDALREQLARIEHERWAGWQNWVHEQCEAQADGSLVIPAALVERWERQIATSYDHLGEDEKASDRREVDRYWPLIVVALERIPELESKVDLAEAQRNVWHHEADSYRRRAEWLETAARRAYEFLAQEGYEAGVVDELRAALTGTQDTQATVADGGAVAIPACHPGDCSATLPPPGYQPDGEWVRHLVHCKHGRIHVWTGVDGWKAMTHGAEGAK